jgi:hypothetical protein
VQGPEQVYDDQLLFNWQNVFWGANTKLAQLQVATLQRLAPPAVCHARMTSTIMTRCL